MRRALEEAQAHWRVLESERQVLEARRQASEEKVQQLGHQLKLLKGCLSGSRSEMISTEEPSADTEEDQSEPKTQRIMDRKQGMACPHGRNPLPGHLPRIRIEHSIVPARSKCPDCPDHPALKQIGEDIREKPYKLPVQYVVHRYVYPKCACQRCQHDVVMPGGANNRLKADITLVFGSGSPGGAGRTRRILQQQYVQSDETSVRMRPADGTMRVARLRASGLPWVQVVFDFHTNKSHNGPEEWLKGGQAGYLQADGAEVVRA